MKLFLKEIPDTYARENFQRLQDTLKNDPLRRGGFKFFELEIAGAVINLKIMHKLGFTPKDVIQTGVTGSGTLTWNFSEFDSQFLDVTTTGPVTVRAFIGTYREGSE
jgi:hypothetical protein